MTDRTHDPDEIPELRALESEAAPPPELEDRVVADLRQRGLLNGIRRGFRSRLVRRELAVAAGVALFLAGWVAHSPRQPVPATEVQPTYALLLRSGPDYRPTSDEEEQQLVKEYGAWARGLHEKGQLISGEKLNDDSRTLVSREGTVTLLEPAPEQGLVQGFFLIRAGSFDQALEIASACPHLRYGGVIEVRPIDPT
ncbi:MAG: YciI family protein [Candidatus Acidiferrales bacterium]